ncbi:integrase arm-type DNA-binding domain-containing protein [uncultured Sphingomonas sp.]|uniref:tyrosine-type recombinase/integrase n=1 Tax=uncultured Sphingomonas sp. TaxID=158754 RepID=UPI0025E891C4|nr:integrase arm-type DNA-binding domain-containing protein [uncultured Sphingomonas sp.]
MERALNRLTVREVAALKQPGRHSDGGGLYLRISPSGARSWAFMHVSAGKRTELGLGSASALTLAAARKVAGDMREAVALGRDPRDVLAPKVDASFSPENKVVTFGEFANEYISTIEDGWKNEVHRKQWRNSLRDHAGALFTLPIETVDTDSVEGVLRPIWLTKAETAKRLRGRIERILDAAKVKGLRPSDSINPAQWRGHLALLLPPQSKLERGHHAALPYQQAPSFFTQLRARTANAARCLEFTILTAARSGEALGATWAEMNPDAETWTMPASRMKAGQEHIVPLSSGAIEVLKSVMPENLKLTDHVFAVNGASRSNMAMAMLLRRMGYGHVTTHGFRSTFRDWAGDETNFPREVIEQALAHTIQNKAERAYRRGTAVERRRELMDAWAKFLGA